MNIALAVAIALCGTTPPVSATSPFVFREISPTAVELSQNGNPVFVYNYGTVSAS